MNKRLRRSKNHQSVHVFSENLLIMSKRIKSDFNFAPQLKKHIGELDVEYVCNRQSVYGKFNLDN